MYRKEEENFSERLVKIRKSKGLSQQELSSMTGISRRMIAHYETKIVNVPPDSSVKLAKALNITIDELMGHKPLKQKESTKTRKLVKKLKTLEKLPPHEQKTITSLIDSLSAKYKKSK